MTPVCTEAQQRTRRIGAFVVTSPVQEAYARALREGLSALGWIEGKNIQSDFRWARPDPDKLRADAASLVDLNPEVIVSGGTQATTVLRDLTERIPIVFVHVADPVQEGLVQSLPHPGANITGFAAYEFSIAGKWLELLKEIAPRTTNVLVLAGPNPTWRTHVKTMQDAAPLLEIQLTIAHVKSAAEIEAEVDAFAKRPRGAMIALPDIMLSANHERITGLAGKYRLPDLYANVQALGNGLIRYSSDWPDLYRRAATYVDRILKGAEPGDLPVQQPVKFELIINLKTASALGLTVPPALLARADEVIE
ncbi:ABC transporter substrate-binding protein [Bradyrhizobium guangzhouense]|uniref:ABC transporter substrate-binding protein n=2 Tax=Bradyrhizobium guangzhouense TaxID=1325095 RepID=A0AAE5X4B9_9BRAD|nr:ABC transporter substrate-binding protein [Bradyrhizobium guangzhouense]QAU48438.1 ABC transporter substrate-binding protein [Bradyrhizobium guangzhouense]